MVGCITHASHMEKHRLHDLVFEVQLVPRRHCVSLDFGRILASCKLPSGTIYIGRREALGVAFAIGFRPTLPASKTMMFFYLLAFLGLTPFSQAGQVWRSDALLAVVQIQQTLNLFPLAVDSHNYTILDQVFATDATANFATSAGYLQGLTAIKDGLRVSLGNTTSQHAFTTQSIDVVGGRKASAVTYLTGTFFGKGSYEGQIFTTYGR